MVLTLRANIISVGVGVTPPVVVVILSFASTGSTVGDGLGEGESRLLASEAGVVWAESEDEDCFLETGGVMVAESLAVGVGISVGATVGSAGALQIVLNVVNP